VLPSRVAGSMHFLINGRPESESMPRAIFSLYAYSRGAPSPHRHGDLPTVASRDEFTAK
jgi:hypothetical protein